ncbi:hypothetical protein F3Y22_tig00008013pilonHSYRG00240 [Hibiscus syriacus]|uniref:RNase H type-1 domain-containing protein n=1 Tax=Hibiscus syriacus TaxID=106335 RepID=A0A6A3CET6_HIBSY|nr:hypothetical protein F3Y22_tig00008013pilonHSYRG00240 [Hibiscus syriacus]
MNSCHFAFRCLGLAQQNQWLISAAAALWGIWLARNELIFENKSTSLKDLPFCVKMRAFLWIRAVNESLILVEADWWNDPTGCLAINPPCLAWNPPAAGSLKFNVDGAFKDSLAGCGGILRDSKGNIKAKFSSPIHAENSDLAELLAIKTTLEILLETGWLGLWNLIVESDSQLALNWTGSIALRPWRWWDLFEELDCLRVLSASKLLKMGFGGALELQLWCTGAPSKFRSPPDSCCWGVAKVLMLDCRLLQIVVLLSSKSQLVAVPAFC